MELGDSDPTAKKGAAAEIYCSICLDVVRDGGNRATAKLQCRHEFHLDCIGSAFNAKGLMQCPNCREIGKGDWLYSNGSRSLPERSFDEWTHDEDLYDFSYSEMPFGVHWCPFSRLARLPESFEEGETSPAIAFQDLSGYHAMFTGNTATSSSSNQCPYLAYMPALQISSYLNLPFSAESHSDGMAFHHNWRRGSRQADVQTPQILPAAGLHFHNWEHYSPMYSQTGSHSAGSNQDTDSSATARDVRVDSDGLLRAGSPPVHYILSHGNSSRSTGSFMSTISPPYFTNSQSHPHSRDHFQHRNPPSIPGAVFSGIQQSAVPYAPLDQTSYYLFPPTASSSHSSQESESMQGDHFYLWGGDQLAPPFPMQPFDREASWWRHIPQSDGSSDSGSRWGFWHGNGSERPSSQGRPSPVGRMRPYN